MYKIKSQHGFTMKKQKFLNIEDLRKVAHATSNFDSKKHVALEKQFNKSIQKVRTILQNYFPEQLKFTIVKEIISESELVGKIFLHDCPVGFEKDDKLIEYVYSETVKIIKYEFDNEKWSSKYTLVIDIVPKSISGIFKLQVKRD